MFEKRNPTICFTQWSSVLETFLVFLQYVSFPSSKKHPNMLSGAKHEKYYLYVVYFFLLLSLKVDISNLSTPISNTTRFSWNIIVVFLERWYEILYFIRYQWKFCLIWKYFSFSKRRLFTFQFVLIKFNR